MANKVRFDYSKASKFISAHEVEYMKELTLAAKEKLVSKSGAGNDFLGGSIFRQIMTKKNLHGSRKLLQRSRAIQRFFL